LALASGDIVRFFLAALGALGAAVAVPFFAAHRAFCAAAILALDAALRFFLRPSGLTAGEATDAAFGGLPLRLPTGDEPPMMFSTELLMASICLRQARTFSSVSMGISQMDGDVGMAGWDYIVVEMAR